MHAWSRAPGPSPSYAWLPSYQLPRPAPPGYRVPLPLPSDALRAARDFAPDVVHAQSPFVSGLMARRLARRSGSPLVFTHHTRFDDYGHYLGPLARAGAGTLAAYLHDYWAGCAAVIAPGSELALDIARRLGNRQRAVVTERATSAASRTGWAAEGSPVTGLGLGPGLGRWESGTLDTVGPPSPPHRTGR